MRNLIAVGVLVKKTRVKNSQRGTAGTIRRNSLTVGVLTRKTRLMNNSRGTMMKKNDSCSYSTYSRARWSLCNNSHFGIVPRYESISCLKDHMILLNQLQGRIVGIAWVRIVTWVNPPHFKNSGFGVVFLLRKKKKKKKRKELLPTLFQCSIRLKVAMDLTSLTTEQRLSLLQRRIVLQDALYLPSREVRKLEL